MVPSIVACLPTEPVQPASIHRLGYCGRTPGTPERDSDAWYTPPAYIASARQVMGSIDLDPFSSATANRIVQARYYFSPEKSALTHHWRDVRKRRSFPQGVTVWMNPPYSVHLLPSALETFLRYWHSRDIAQAIVLVNNCTETQWFRAMREASQAVCFPTTRIAFLAPDGKQVSGNTRGQAFFYYGPTAAAERFCEEFRQYGWTIAQHRGWK